MRAILISFATAALLAACSQKVQQAAPKTDDEKALYALGGMVGSNIQNFEFTDQELAMVQAGFADAVKDKLTLKPEELQTFVPKLQELQRTRQEAAVERNKKAGAEYVAKAATEAGAEKTDSGVVYKTVKEGTGAAPTPTDTVKVHYEGRLLSGKVFDSSREQGQPIEFPLNQVIPCWTEGVQKMKVGGTAQLVCPSDRAYGDQGNPSIPGGSTLVFDVELLEIVKADAGAPAAP